MSTYSPTEPPRIYPTFLFENAASMIDWLGEAFGFTVHNRYDAEDGTVAHAELALGSSIIMLGQARADQYATIVGGPDKQGGKSLYIAVNDVDALFERAKAAGASIEEGLTERDYGSREFICRDPEGNVWCFGTYWPKAGDKS